MALNAKTRPPERCKEGIEQGLYSGHCKLACSVVAVSSPRFPDLLCHGKFLGWSLSLAIEETPAVTIQG